MRTFALAFAAAAFVGSTAALSHERHQHFHERRGHTGYEAPDAANSPRCGCRTYTTTIYGEPTLGGIGPVPAVYTTQAYTPTAPVPLPYKTTYYETGTYTIPATTVTVTSTSTVPYPTSTVCPPGKHTYGGVVISVATSTVTVVPYPHKTTTSGTVYSTVTPTTYTCPSAGKYTIGPYTTTVTKTKTIEYPTLTRYAPGTYTQAAKTVTVTETGAAYTCPYEIVVAKPTPSVYVPPPKPKNTKSVYVAPPKPTLQSYNPPKPKPHKPKHPYSGPKVNGNQWAMTYTPYDNSGNCKSASQVSADITRISAAGFTTLRLYSTDCGTLQSVGAACTSLNLKVVLGIFIDGSGIDGAREQLTDIVAWGRYDMVEMVVVGNEAMFNGYVSAAELSSFIAEVRSTLAGKGCNVPVTTTEPLSTMQQYGSQLCNVLDVIGANLHPYFNSGTSASGAGDFVASQLELLGNICPGLEAYNLETGWPNGGSANGAAIPGYAEQKQAILSIVEKVGKKSAIFSFENDLWKDSGYNGVEQHFGCLSVFGQ